MKMTSCRKIEENMSLALDGLLDEVELQAMEAHVAVCPRCAQTWEAMRRASALFSAGAAMEMMEPPADFVEAVMGRIEIQRQSRERRLRNFLLLAGLGGATALLLIAGAWLGGVLLGLPALRSTGALFISQLFAGLRTLGSGLGIPLRVLGPAPVAGALFIMFLVAGSATGLWAWALVHIQRRARLATVTAQ